MTTINRSYRLSIAAAKDISDIYDYTVSKFGERQAIKYLNGLDERLSYLNDHPEAGRIRDEVKKELKSYPYQKHIVFYRSMQYGIKVVRVLHGSMDIPKQFHLGSR